MKLNKTAPMLRWRLMPFVALWLEARGLRKPGKRLPPELAE